MLRADFGESFNNYISRLIPCLRFPLALPHVHECECPHVGEFLDELGGGLASAVPGAGFNAHQNRGISCLSLLQSCPKLKAVCWENTVIVITGHHHGWGVAFSNVDIVIRRICFERSEFIRVIR